MSRRNCTPEEKARRAKIRELLQEANVVSMADIQNLFKETIAEFMENGLKAKLDEEPNTITAISKPTTPGTGTAARR